MSDLCQMYIRFMSDLCPIYVRCMSDLCPIYIRFMTDLCPMYVRFEPIYHVIYAKFETIYTGWFWGWCKSLLACAGPALLKLELWKLELWKLESGSGARGALGAGLWELELSRHKLREYMKECTKHLMKTQDACAHRQFTFYSKIDTVNLTVLWLWRRASQ